MHENLIAAFNGASIVPRFTVEADVVIFSGSGDPDSDLLVADGVVSLTDKVAAISIREGNGGKSLVVVVAEPTKLVVLDRVEAHDGSLVLRVLCMRMNEKREGS